MRGFYRFVGSVAAVLLFMYIVLNINDPLQVYDRLVLFVRNSSRSVAALSKVWDFLAFEEIFILDDLFEDSYVADILSGKGVWSFLRDLILGDLRLEGLK
ncbi:MAG: hypothetical protein IJW99_10600 [Clostridia bacterium]|nr:hypothetical protein [Clostridia bacterium]